MSRKVRNRLLVAATVGAFALAAWISGTVLGLSGTNRWILRGCFWAFGIASGFIVHRLLERKSPAAEPEEKEDEEIGDLFGEARRTLAASGVDGGRVSRLPLVLVVGPPASTKTTLVERSGIEVELVAGDVYRGEAVVPTRAVNLWYGEGTVFCEAAGGMLDAEERWARLVRHLRPERLGAALRRGSQAPRIAVVCFPCEEFVEAGGSETVPAAARKIRERLKEAAEKLGIRLPVYVVFTKADRLPHFEDFARNLSREEAREVLGATLPLDRHADGGAYAEREGAFLARRFDELFHSLSRRRLELLHREGDEDASARLYEFPREFRKARDLAVRFLVELGRPSQLSVSPVVRGFYFTGVRPIVVEEGASPAPVGASGGGDAPVGATMVFDRSALEAARAAPSPAASRGARRVPEWVFLPGILRRVVLGDRAARALTGGGTRVNFVRRALAGGALALGILAAGAVGLSFLRNRALAEDVRAAVERVDALPPPASPGAAALDPEALRAQLLAMEPLRQVVGRLREHQTDGRPWSLRWGLYRGAALLPPAREAYFRRFRSVLAVPVRDSLERFLGALPSPPDGSVDYDRAYDALKAYLVMTEHPDRSAPEFLAPALAEFRLGPGREGGGADATGQEEESGDAGGGAAESAGAGRATSTDSLVRGHYAFYARELPIDDPYDMRAAGGLVADARQYLVEASGEDRFYAAMIDKAEGRSEGVRFVDPTGVVSAPHAVSGAFTRDGWRFIQTNLEEDIESLLARDDWSWVVGEARPYGGDRRELADSLRSRYVRDYVQEWEAYLSSASVRGFRTVSQAARSLGVLSESRSPLLRLLGLASWHTQVDTTLVGPVFEPVRIVVPPDTARYVAGPNEPYVGALSDLQGSMEELAEAGGPEKESVAEQVDDDAAGVRSEAGNLERQFPTADRAIAVGALVKELLEQPAWAAERLARVAPVADLNAAGRNFCEGFGELLARYPFDPDATREADVDQLAAMLQPGEGLFWKFYDERLSDLLTREGNPQSMEAGQRLTPEFRAFFRRAAEISDALFQNDEARVNFILKMETFEGLPEVTVNIDGREQTFSRTRSPTGTFVWIAEQARSARISGRIGGNEETLLNHRGPWAVFKLLGQARWEQLSRTSYRLRWEEAGARLQGELRFEVAAPILNPAYLDRLDCVPRITR